MILDELFGPGPSVEEDRQANPGTQLYKCIDGKMRSGYEKSKFDGRVRWTWLGFTILPDPRGDR